MEEDIMKKDIKILEECIHLFKSNDTKCLSAFDIRALENLIKEYKRVKAGRDWFWESRTAELATPEMLHKILRLQYIPRTKVKEKILTPMKEEHDKAIQELMATDIIECAKAGAVAQTLDHFIGKIEELLDNNQSAKFAL